jgi:uncharacterized membrane protein YqjE
MLLHPVVHLLATRPQWLAEHVDAYGELASAELSDAAAHGLRSLALAAVALCALGVAVTLAGVAVMLWAVTPTLSAPTQWALLITPAAPLLVALVCLVLRRLWHRSDLFALLVQQLQADVALLREGAAS